jgi:8-oxo-dGTP pyrophosphatase MutT (NUDIX family)
VAGIGLDAVVDALARAGLLLEGTPGPPAPADRPLAPSLLAPTRRDPAAVLVPLFEEAGEARVLLTRRSSALRSHTGQVSFPGGRIDPGEGPVEAALREADEEVGLDPSGVRPVGWLHPAVTFSSGTGIVPVVGLLEGRPALRPNPAEVARAFDVSLAELAAAYSEEHWTEPEVGTFPVYVYEVTGETVWGATARMLTELLGLVLVGPPR